MSLLLKPANPNRVSQIQDHQAAVDVGAGEGFGAGEGDAVVAAERGGDDVKGAVVFGDEWEGSLAARFGMLERDALQLRLEVKCHGLRLAEQCIGGSAQMDVAVLVDRDANAVIEPLRRDAVKS